MSKISIARRRIELRNRHRLPEPWDSHSERRQSFSLVGGSALREAHDSGLDDRALAFPIDETDARLIESLAPHLAQADQQVNATLHREGTLLVLRIQPPALAKRLIACDQVSEMLGMSRSYVYHLVRDGKLPAYRIGRNLRFDPADVFAFLSMCLNGSGGMPCI